MKLLKVTVTFVVLGLIIFLAVSCSSSSGSTTTTKTQVATAQKGSISVLVTGTGNLALSTTKNLAFEMAGTVQEVLVNTGDSVKEGQELAKLDTSVWGAQVKTLSKALTTAQRNLTSTESDLTKAQRDVSSKEMAVQQAQLDLKSAQNAVGEIAEVKEAQDAINSVQNNLNVAQANLQSSAAAGMDTAYWRTLVSQLQATLAADQKDLQDILSGTSITVSNDVELQVAQAQLKVQQSQKALEDAQLAVDDANTAVANAQLDVNDAQQAVTDAQSDLDEAKALSPVIKAPFAGFITKVNVNGGDEIQKGTVAMQIADPNQFEANMLITEQDIASLTLGGDATVSLDAFSGLNFPAKITAIAPTATISQGVVNYQVTVDLTSLQPVSANQTATAQTSSTATAYSTQGVPATSGVSTVPSGTAGNAGSSQNMPLKDGMSATVNIVVQQKVDILMIPNRAITRQGQNTTVQVVKGTTTETRTVKTGISDSTNTEITNGLSEGEQVLIKSSTSSTSSSSQSSNSRIGIPGIGGP